VAANAPDLALWHGEIGPEPLLEALIAAQVPVVAVDVPAPPGEVGRRRAWRGLLGGLSRILVRDEAAARVLRQLGPAGLRLEVAGRFVPVPDPPPCEESDRDHFAQLLHARPAWLAVFPTEAEIPAFVEAHRLALQGAHRLLLLLCPRDPAQGAPLASWLRGEGWRVARHNAGEEPDDGTEVFVVDDPEELGLWYRLAPICAIGGSFRPDAVGSADPADAARLGSAILCGPESTPHAEWIERLDRAGGLARVDDLGSLGVVLSDMLSPDRAASLAQVAWDVASDGARVQERVVAALRDVLRDAPSGAAPGRRAGDGG
jgi:3-deoxy-D-manno-octulosonic-acid transferase